MQVTILGEGVKNEDVSTLQKHLDRRTCKTKRIGDNIVICNNIRALATVSLILNKRREYQLQLVSHTKDMVTYKLAVVPTDVVYLETSTVEDSTRRKIIDILERGNYHLSIKNNTIVVQNATPTSVAHSLERTSLFTTRILRKSRVRVKEISMQSITKQCTKQMSRVSI
jgi:hypothetical protein